VLLLLNYTLCNAPKTPAQVMTALRYYRNIQSVAVGLSYYFNDRFMRSAGIVLS